MYTLETLFKSS